MTLLTEKAQTAKLVLEKIDLPSPPPMRVVNVFDVSYSATPFYQSFGSTPSAMQQVFNQFLGAAIKLDDNGEIDTYIFDNECSKVGTAGPKDYDTYIANKLLRSGGHLWGSTCYSKPIDMIMKDMFGSSAGSSGGGFLGGMFGKKPAGGSNDPVLVFFVTDGEDARSDEERTSALLKASIGKPIYWFFIGVGTATSFKFLQDMADAYDNVGFIKMPKLQVSDEAIYTSLFDAEFAGWVKALPKR